MHWKNSCLTPLNKIFAKKELKIHTSIKYFVLDLRKSEIRELLIPFGIKFISESPIFFMCTVVFLEAGGVNIICTTKTKFKEQLRQAIQHQSNFPLCPHYHSPSPSVSLSFCPSCFGHVECMPFFRAAFFA